MLLLLLYAWQLVKDITQLETQKVLSSAFNQIKTSWIARITFKNVLPKWPEAVV